VGEAAGVTVGAAAAVLELIATRILKVAQKDRLKRLLIKNKIGKILRKSIPL